VQQTRGICCTILLPMNELALAGNPEVADAGTLVLLLGFTASIIVSAILVSRLAVYYRRLREVREYAVEKLER
jgi:NhaA family Na+:H+ antiporter